MFKILLAKARTAISLQGQPATTNKDAVRITIPKQQILTPKELKAIMKQSEHKRQGLLENYNN